MSYIVAGWYTPSYAHWVAPLKSDLEKIGARYDFVEVPPLAGGWETRTRQKAIQVRAAMDRHPDKTIVFLDVDCTVTAALDDIVDTRADVLLYVRAKRRRNGKVEGRVRSGTMVLRPTPGASALVEAWIAENACAQPWDTDQHTLARAMATVPDCVSGCLPPAYCAVVGDNHPAPVIFHSRASAHEHKITRWRRRLHKLVTALQWAPLRWAPARG